MNYSSGYLKPPIFGGFSVQNKRNAFISAFLTVYTETERLQG